MLTNWLTQHHIALETEFQQAQDEGRDLTAVADEFARLLVLVEDNTETGHEQETAALFDKTVQLPVAADYPYDEPSTLGAIQLARPRRQVTLPPFSLSSAVLLDKLAGAWAGRCSGCLLGKPVEGWDRARMEGFLRESGRWPLSDYFRYASTPLAIRERYGLDTYWTGKTFVDQVESMPEDDDLNYTVAALAIAKQYGLDFSPADVAEFWMDTLPILHTMTAEAMAYRNFCQLIAPPLSASVRNPYREWIGAQIRADFWGYVSPGDPSRAASLAWRDACISHTRNGIYGAMWVAAMNAAAFVTADRRLIIQAGLAEIPARSRLSSAIATVLHWHEQELDYQQVIDRIHLLWDEHNRHDAVHTVSNAMIVAMGILWGEGEFGTSICRAVQACFDTDSNGATTGSILGILHGYAALPARWVDPLHDTLHTGLAGYSVVRLQDMAQQTYALAQPLQTVVGPTSPTVGDVALPENK